MGRRASSETALARRPEASAPNFHMQGATPSETLSALRGSVKSAPKAWDSPGASFERLSQEPPRPIGQLASTTAAWKEAEAQTQRLKLTVGLSPGQRLAAPRRSEDSPLLSRSRMSRASASSVSWRSRGTPECIAKIALEAGRSEEADRQHARLRADRLIGALSSLRRANDPRRASGAVDEECREGPLSPKSPRVVSTLTDYAARRSTRAQHDLKRAEMFGTLPAEEASDDLPLLQATLSELADSSSSLLAGLAAMEAAQEPIAENGGSRHPTAVLAARSAAVLVRKAELLQKAEARSAAFERAHAAAAELNELLREQDVDTPPDLLGTKDFLSTVLHKDGRPQDADKSDFEGFASSFGLDRQHQEILKIKRLQAEACDWWAQKLLEEIENGTTTDHMQRMIRILKEINEGEDLPALKQAGAILSDKLAERVLVAAEQLKAQDAEAKAASTTPDPENCRRCADRIAEDLRLSKAMGCTPKHPKMLKAKGIEVAFRLEEKNRHARKVLLAARERRDRDAKAAEQAKLEGQVPEVGMATTAAEAIDADIDRVTMAEGVMPTHADLREAKQVAKDLRDVEGQRRRLQAREKRLREKETAAGGR